MQSVVAMRVVTADGSVRTLGSTNADMDELEREMWWGCRGAAAALDPGGDEADREDHVAFARGLERARGSPALVKARVIRARRGREAGVVSGRVRQVHAALGAEIPEVRRDEVLERSHGDRGREVAGAVKGRTKCGS